MLLEILFFELLQVAVGTRKELTRVPTAKEWALLFDMAKKQALVGVCFVGCQRLLSIQRPPEIFWLQWLGMEAKIQQRNQQALEVCRKLTAEYKKDGFDSCVMKGQSNRVYYPLELAESRTSGDVDMWVRPSEASKNPVKEVMEYFERKHDVVSLCYLHIENHPVPSLGLGQGCVPLEVHFRPSFFNCPSTNRRFLKWMKWEDCVEWSDALDMNVLKIEYNLVFQMNHLYRHLLDEGVGLRQVLDYYFLLEKFAQWCSFDSVQDRRLLSCENGVIKQVKNLGMWRFAGALMYVLKEVFAMPDEYQLCVADEKEGHFLLDEIMRSGNFGHHDPRMQKRDGNSHSLKNQLHRAWLRARRNIRFVTSYPSEVLWEPVARVDHFLWRKFKLWRF